MASHSEDPSVLKDRIIQHMNEDHHDALVYYLQFYANASPQEATSAYLVDINTDGMKITRVIEPNYTPQPVVIPIVPPMGSLKQARERLVAMTFESMEGLGRSRWRIESYPNISLPGFIYGALGVIIFTLVLFPNETLRPGARTRRLLLQDSEPAARWLYAYQRELRSIIMGSAVYVAMVPMRRRLQRHCYKSSSGRWLAWFAVAFFEGPFACRSFDAKVRAVELQSNKKH